jgi:hypothetical protein
MIILFVALMIPASDSQSASPNLIVTGLRIDKTRINQKTTIAITYRLKPEGLIHSCFNMGLWCHKGSLGKQLKTWGLPSSLCNDIKTGRTISQTRSVKMPDWGPGVYEIVIVADVDDYLKEENRQDNIKRKQIQVVHTPAATSSIAGRVTGLNLPCKVYLYGPENLSQVKKTLSINSPGAYTFADLSRGRYRIRIGGRILEDTWVHVTPGEKAITCTGIAVKNVNFKLQR